MLGWKRAAVLDVLHKVADCVFAQTLGGMERPLVPWR